MYENQEFDKPFYSMDFFLNYSCKSLELVEKQKIWKFFEQYFKNNNIYRWACKMMDQNKKINI